MNWYALATLVTPPSARPISNFEEVAREALASLPPHLQRTVERFCDGVSLRAIARSEGVSHETVRLWLYKAIKQVRPSLASLTEPYTPVLTPDQIPGALRALEEEKSRAWNSFYPRLSPKRLTREALASLDEQGLDARRRYSALCRKIGRLRLSLEQGKPYRFRLPRTQAIPPRVQGMARRWAQRGTNE